MDTGQIAEKLTSWLRERVLSAGCQGLVVGMSGGLDSSVLAVLCQRAFTQNTLGVILPCHSSQEDREHARLIANKFAIPTRTVALDAVFDIMYRAVADDRIESSDDQVTQANLKARLRMLTLYYFANQLRYMVAGSSNRSELAVGYCTKYGDGGVDIMPLGNLVKGQVIELARFLGIPRQIIDKLPSAGLWVGQTDEDELGFSYEELDRYLTTGEASGELKKKIESRMAASNHKRLPPPIANLQA